MNDAKLYQENNFLQKRDAFDCLEEYADKIKWRKRGDKIIDIGCGDGSVTVKLLKEYIPDNFEKLLGCDISEKMVKFANGHHKDDKTTFSVLDIAGDLPEDMKRKFDHAFSFYTLHWIKEQESAFKNIFDLITNGRRLPSHGVERFISPYHDSQEPEKEIRTLMTKIGYSDIVVKCQEKMFVYDSPEAMKKAVRAVNPFKMPKVVFDDFMLDYLQVVRDMKLIDEANNNKTSVRAHYTLIVVYGTK
ncbi:hypothetical protein ACJJTC_006704 [Scirpophaga incertulas]